MARLKQIFATLLLLFIFVPNVVLANSNTHVVDYVDYFTDQQKDSLQEVISHSIHPLDMDAVILLTDTTDNKSIEAYADDFYDFNGYGIDEEYSGLIMVIDTVERDIYISTTGKAIDIFSDSLLDSMLDDIIDAMVDNDETNYYLASEKFLQIVEENVVESIPLTFWERILKLVTNPSTYISSIIIGGIITLCFWSSSTKDKKTPPYNYEVSGSFKVLDAQDHFVRAHTSKVKIATQSSSSSSSSSRSTTRTSSSGRTHGGGGRKF